MLPSLEIDEIRFESATILAAFPELTGTHFCCWVIGDAAHIGAVAFTAKQLVGVACCRWAEAEEVAELRGREVKLSGVARLSLHHSPSQGLFCNLEVLNHLPFCQTLYILLHVTLHVLIYLRT